MLCWWQYGGLMQQSFQISTVQEGNDYLLNLQVPEAAMYFMPFDSSRKITKQLLQELS